MNFFNKKSSRGRAKWHALVIIIVVLMCFVVEWGRGTKESGRRNWEKHIREETFYLEGLERDYTLLFLTDMHMVMRDENAEEQVAQHEEKRFSLFVNEEGVSSAEQFPEWIQYANENQVDAVLLGGDIIDTPSDANRQWLREQLAQLDMPYLYVNGNHDWTYPWEYMTPKGKEIYLPLLAPFMQGNTTFQTLDFGRFLIVGIDDSTNQVDAEALQEYESIRKDGRPMIVMAHVPFLTQSVLAQAKEVWEKGVVIGAGNFGGIYPNEESRQFMDLTVASDSPVELVLAGHVHFYNKDVMEGEKNVPQVVGGAGYQGNGMLIHLTGTKETYGTEKQ